MSLYALMNDQDTKGLGFGLMGTTGLKASPGFHLMQKAMPDLGMQNLAMALLDRSRTEAPQMPAMPVAQVAAPMAGQAMQGIMQGYNPLAISQQNDEIMRQRMGGLLALLGGQ